MKEALLSLVSLLVIVVVNVDGGPLYYLSPTLLQGLPSSTILPPRVILGRESTTDISLPSSYHWPQRACYRSYLGLNYWNSWKAMSSPRTLLDKS